MNKYTCTMYRYGFMSFLIRASGQENRDALAFGTNKEQSSLWSLPLDSRPFLMFVRVTRFPRGGRQKEAICDRGDVIEREKTQRSGGDVCAPIKILLCSVSALSLSLQ